MSRFLVLVREKMRPKSDCTVPGSVVGCQRATRLFLVPVSFPNMSHPVGTVGAFVSWWLNILAPALVGQSQAPLDVNPISLTRALTFDFNLTITASISSISPSLSQTQRGLHPRATRPTHEMPP